MCGFAAVFDLDATTSHHALLELVKSMAGHLEHRGPDDEGYWCDASTGLALGHRRLAVVDTSPAGAQPMVSRDERWVLAYNGELYGVDRLAKAARLDRGALRGHSDTEVLVETISRIGLHRTLDSADGMFAFAAWDRQDRVLHVVRDRLGEKPLYVARDGRHVLVASELRSLVSGMAPREDARGLAAFLRYGFVPAPLTIFEDVAAVEPGHHHWFSARSEGRETWWDLAAAVVRGREHRLQPNEAADAVESLLADVVAEQRVADVPLGILLSGGVDSSLLAAIAVGRGAAPVTFTVGFEQGIDESIHARGVAHHLGTDHHEVRFSADDALEMLRVAGPRHDQPFSDPAQLPLQLVARAARRLVTVALTGDGGDEVFGGYEHQALAERVLAISERTPRALRRAARSLEGSRAMPLPVGRRLGVLGLEGARGVYDRVISHWRTHETEPARELLPVPPAGCTGAETIRFLDQRFLLPSAMLTKTDRSTMAESLECRAPLLDPRIVELSWRLPPACFHRSSGGKPILREVLQRRVPSGLVDRPKQGFSAPIAQWLRGPLRERVDTTLSAPDDARDHILEPARIAASWRALLRGDDREAVRIWDILMLGLWREAQA